MVAAVAAAASREAVGCGRKLRPKKAIGKTEVKNKKKSSKSETTDRVDGQGGAVSKTPKNVITCPTASENDAKLSSLEVEPLRVSGEVPEERVVSKSSGLQRQTERLFSFKSFSRRLDEINIDVYRSLDLPIAEPSEGSSFFRDCLLKYRELNTAAEFMSFYDHNFPLVQSLPMIILQKESIINSLLSRLKMEGRLSLEPILRLIAALSRDLLDEFIPFLQRISDSLECLLSTGGDRDTEIIEQIFTSWSLMMMHLQKYLLEDLDNVLRITEKLRYYPKDYVREFMAESISFLLRKAPFRILKKVILNLMMNVAMKPSEMRKSAVGILISHAMRITSSRLHSKAETLMPFLLESPFLVGAENEGSRTVLDILIVAFNRLCAELDTVGVSCLWKSLCEKIKVSMESRQSTHLVQLLSLLLSIVQDNHPLKFCDFESILDLADMLVKSCISPFVVTLAVGTDLEVIDKVFQVIVCFSKGLPSSNKVVFSEWVSSRWDFVFRLKSRSLLVFVEDLLANAEILYPIRGHIAVAFSNLIGIYTEDVLHLMVIFCKELEGKSSGFQDLVSKEELSTVCIFLEETLHYFIAKISRVADVNLCSSPFQENELATLWAVVTCFPHFSKAQSGPSILMDLINAVEELLMVDCEFAGFTKDAWKNLMGAALSSYHKSISIRNMHYEDSVVFKFMDLTKSHKSSPKILSAVADILDSVAQTSVPSKRSGQYYLPEYVGGKTIDALNVFEENLFHANKEIRLSTLRILCHYDPISFKDATEVDISKDHKVFTLLRSVEEIGISISTSREAIRLISSIQMALNSHAVDDQCLSAVLCGIVGIFNIRFSYLWNAAMECLSVLLSLRNDAVCDRFFKCLVYWQNSFLSSPDNHLADDENPRKDAGLIGQSLANLVPSFDSTPGATVLTLLIQCLQKVPQIVESLNRRLIPLFLKFLGCNLDTIKSDASQMLPHRGKEWKGVLKEWLALFRLLHNPKAFYQGQAFKDVLLYRLLDQNDADIQMKAFECLINWKDDFLLPYAENMKNLINAKSMRDELIRWGLSKNSLHSIDMVYRTRVVPIVIRILIPKVKNLKMISGQKATGANHRRAVLGFLAQLEIDELQLFFELLFKPLLSASGVEDVKVDASEIMKHFTTDVIEDLSWKKTWGFLHVIEDIIAVFDEYRLAPFLDLLMSCVVQILAYCAPSVSGFKCSASFSEKSCQSDSDAVHHDDVAEQITDKKAAKQFKALRSFCLKISYLVLNKYDNHDFGEAFWDLFFNSLKHLIANLKQEGASGKNPSSLFQCFLAMSKSHKLVLLLIRQDNLVSDIISMLTVPSASESIVSNVLKFVNNLLELDTEPDSDDTTLRRIILSNLDVLLTSLHSLFSRNTSTKRKLPDVRELAIFSFLPKYIKEPSAAEKFLDVLLPLVEKSHRNPDSCFNTLNIIREVVVLLGSASTNKVLHSITPLLISAGFAVRNSICDVLDAVAANDSSVVILAKIMRELNATSEVDIGGLDYEKILCAYEKIDVRFFYTMREEHTLPILALCINDMASEDLILQQSALRLLTSFIEFLGETLQESESLENAWSKASIMRIVRRFFLRHIRNAMENEGVVRRLWIDLLKEMVVKLPTVADLGSYSILCSSDADQDFFNNIIHLQKHRRARAVRRFQDVVSSGKLSVTITNNVFVPLLFRMLYDAQDGKDEHIRSACVDALASISYVMKWDQYYALLIRCFRDLKRKSDKQKTLLRLICAILGNFHFLESSSVIEDGISSIDSHESRSIAVTSSFTLKRCSGTGDMLHIQFSLQKKLLPKVQKLLASDSDYVNVNVSLVALKLLKLLPSEIMDLQLPTIIHRISNLLRHRLESIRDEARSALTSCLKELGLEYLQFVLKVLTGTLKRGFEMHVLGYTLNFMLSKLLINPVCGKLDYCIDDLLYIVKNDILGEVSEEKEVGKIASKMKETRKNKSYETLKLIAQSVTFKNHALKLLSPVTAHIHKELTSKVRSKLEKMLDHIAAGIQCNPSASQTELLIFVHCLIKDGLGIEGHTRLHPHVHMDGEGMENNRNELICVDRRLSHLVTAFALGLLKGYMNKLKLNREDEQLLSLLDPFVSLLVQCLDSKYESIVSAALKCLSLFVGMGLPSFQSLSDKLKNSLLVIAQGSVNAGSELTESCMKLLAVLLRSSRVTLSTDGLRMLIQLPLFIDLAESPSFVALKLLKAIVHRKLVVPEIYDVVLKVDKLMVQNQSEPIRKKCSQILLQFLLEYKLSEKRWQQHLDSLLANLRYEHPAGREAVLEMLHAIILKFPDSVIDAQSQPMFVHLFASLANDDNSKVRSMTAAAIKCLIGHVSVNLLQAIIEYTLSWYGNPNPTLCATAAQVLGLQVEVMGKGFGKHLASVLPVMRTILKSAASCSDHKVPFWKEAYYSLVMLEKILHHFNYLISDVDHEETWETICEFHLHPHLWLRNISNRIYSIYISAVAEASEEKAGMSCERFVLMKPSTLFLSSASFCCQLKVPQTDDRAGNAILHNLAFSICRLDTVLRSNDCMDVSNFWSNLDATEKDRFRKAFDVLDPRKGRSSLASLTSSDAARTDQHAHPFISYLLQRIGKIALQLEPDQMKIIFRCFKSISSRLLCPDLIHSYAYSILVPVYKVCEGFAGRVLPEDVKQEAGEVCEKVQESVGMQSFVQIYSQIKKAVQAKRDKRRQEQKVMAVVNPERQAKRKLRQAAKHRAHKKRKIMAMKIGSWKMR